MAGGGRVPHSYHRGTINRITSYILRNAMKNTPLGESSRQCLGICAFFSATGVIFTSWVGMMLVFQPLYVQGVEDVEAAKRSAFGAAALYFVTFLISALWIMRDSFRQPPQGRQIYRDRNYDDRDNFFPQGRFRDYDDDNVQQTEQDLPDVLIAPSSDRANFTLTDRSRSSSTRSSGTMS